MFWLNGPNQQLIGTSYTEYLAKERNKPPSVSTSAREYVPKFGTVHKLSSSPPLSPASIPLGNLDLPDRCAGLARMYAPTVDLVCRIGRDIVSCIGNNSIIDSYFGDRWHRVAVSLLHGNEAQGNQDSRWITSAWMITHVFHASVLKLLVNPRMGVAFGFTVYTLAGLFQEKLW